MLLTRSLAQDAETLARNVAGGAVAKEEVIRLIVVSLLAGGHLLLDDLPGVGKTLVARSAAASIDGSFKRMQFTPDLLPSDITGSSIFHQAEGRFEFVPGPIFANVVLADEVNRASPRTQSAGEDGTPQIASSAVLRSAGCARSSRMRERLYDEEIMSKTAITVFAALSLWALANADSRAPDGTFLQVVD